MISWPAPFVPAIPPATSAEAGAALRMFDTSSQCERVIGPRQPGDPVRMYVCGITPYDATHLGHAATYVTFDLVGRVLRDLGMPVRYCQNVTDIDDPLLERAAARGIDWVALAEEETALFREDMTALAVVPPETYVGAVESIPRIAETVGELLARGTAYLVPVLDGEGVARDAHDVYLDVAAGTGFGEVCRLPREVLVPLFAKRGGDPDRAGKRDELDPLLWRAARVGEPSWPGGPLGAGRPGWHVECTVIAHDELGPRIDIQGGGSDLIFPHHEMCAVTSEAMTGERPFAEVYLHQAMVGFDGAKMSKSRGNLVLVSALRAAGIDPMAIRLLLVAQHYREDWDYREALLDEAIARLATWRAALSVNAGPAAEGMIATVRERLCADLDGAGAIAAVDEWAQRCLTEGGSDPAAPGLVSRTIDALLGVRV